MATAYEQFHSPPAYHGPPVVTGQLPIAQQQRKDLKFLPSLRSLARIELALALVMILFESIVDGVMASSMTFRNYVPLCTMGHGIWVGILGVIAAGLGLGAFKTSKGNKCMMIAHFVLSIICTVADGIMTIFAGSCLPAICRHMEGSYDWDSRYQKMYVVSASPETVSIGRGLLATESFLLIAAITHCRLLHLCPPVDALTDPFFSHKQHRFNSIYLSKLVRGERAASGRRILSGFDHCLNASRTG